jgi:hypothetical protein
VTFEEEEEAARSDRDIEINTGVRTTYRFDCTRRKDRPVLLRIGSINKALIEGFDRFELAFNRIGFNNQPN